MTTLIGMEQVNLTLGGRSILSNIDLQLKANTITTLIGPNGSGKSTLVRLLLGLIEPDSGRVTRQPKLRIGYMPQKLHIDATLPLTVERFLQLAGRYRQPDLQQALQQVRADHLLGSPMQQLSGGETQQI